MAFDCMLYHYALILLMLILILLNPTSKNFKAYYRLPEDVYPKCWLVTIATGHIPMVTMAMGYI